MPRKKRIDDEIETTERVIEIDPQDLKVRRLMQSMPGGLKCMQVFRYSPGTKGGRPTYIDDISPEQFDFKTLKTMFGGGKFQVKWDNEDGSVSKGDFDIAGPYINFDHQPEVERTPEPIQINQPVQMPVPSSTQAISPMDMLRMIQEARREAREEMRSMLELMRPQQQSPDVTKQVFEIVEKIAPMMSAGDGGGSPWMMALAQFKEPILKIVDSVHVALTRQPVPPSGPPPSATPTPTIQQQAPQEGDMIKLMIRQYLPVFVNAARNNGNPDIYADMILEQLPESLYPKIQEWLTKATWFDDVKIYDPVVIEAQAGWWNLLRTSLLEGIKEAYASSVQHPSNSEHSED